VTRRRHAHSAAPLSDGGAARSLQPLSTARNRGSLTSGSLLTNYGEGGRLVGALTVGPSEELEVGLNDLIAEHAPMDALQRELVWGRSQ
jgi:hypothetical protein